MSLFGVLMCLYLISEVHLHLFVFIFHLFSIILNLFVLIFHVFGLFLSLVVFNLFIVCVASSLLQMIFSFLVAVTNYFES